jgi:SH3-like domain-containing protein
MNMKKVFLFVIFSVLLLAGEASAERLAVGVDRANIRSGAGTDHEILWSVGKYYPLDILKKSGNWYKIRDFEDDEGWVFHSLLKKIPTVIVKAPLVNVRERPGTKSRVLFQAEKGVSFKRLGKKGEWFKIQHADGEVGWIHKSLVWGY